MKEVSRSSPVFAFGLPEVRRGVRLVWTLVLREANVPIDAHHRATLGARVGDESAADLFECGRQIGDQPKKRLLDVRLITLLVRLEPSALVVRLEILEKAEETWPEVTVRCHGLLRHLHSHQVALQGISGVAQV